MEWRRREIATELRLRDVNERLDEAPPGPWLRPYLCECSSAACTERVRLTSEEFRGIRAHPARFVVAPGHVCAGIETVVTWDERYWVVEKTIGEVIDLDHERSARR